MSSTLHDNRMPYKGAIHLKAGVLLTIILLSATGTVAQEVKDIPHISDIRLLRKLGEYDQALGYLKMVLADDATAENVRRQAYNELVTITYMTELEPGTLSAAKVALMQFPDLEADPNHHPAAIQDIYENLRNRMYGCLQLTSYPDGCTVYLNGKEIGLTPLADVYIPVGEQTLRFSKFGYEDEILNVTVEPGIESERFVSMQLYREVSKPRVGLEFNMSLVSLRYDDVNGRQFEDLGIVEDHESVPRLGGGVFLHMTRYDRLALQLGIRYVSYGNRAYYRMYTGLESGQYDSYYHYVAMPVLLKYYFIKNPRIYLLGGPEFAYLISAKLSKTDEGKSIDILEQVRRHQISLVFGAGFEIGVGSHYIFISALHTMGLLSIRESTEVDDVNYTTREWRITFGIIFNWSSLAGRTR